MWDVLTSIYRSLFAIYLSISTEHLSLFYVPALHGRSTGLSDSNFNLPWLKNQRGLGAPCIHGRENYHLSLHNHGKVLLLLFCNQSDWNALRWLCRSSWVTESLICSVQTDSSCQSNRDLMQSKWVWFTDRQRGRLTDRWMEGQTDWSTVYTID